jgi:hypothetical protein
VTADTARRNSGPGAEGLDGERQVRIRALATGEGALELEAHSQVVGPSDGSGLLEDETSGDCGVARAASREVGTLLVVRPTENVPTWVLG